MRKKKSIDRAVVGWLGYLKDLGWNDLYLPRSAAREAAPEAADTGAGATPEPVRAERPAPRPAGPEPELFAREDRSARKDRPDILDQPVPEEAAERTALLVELARFASTCQRCRLAEGRNRVVFGSGNPQADLMFIGEGPGAQEDRQGLPFVGPAGELLTRIIRAIDLSRDEVYIANIVKCRPPNNRDPRPDEVAACRSYLERQIDLIRPKVLVALGRVAAQTLLGNDLSLGKMRGEWWLYQKVELRVTYHPAALLRNAHLKRPTWEDMQVVRDRLRELSAENSAP